MRGSSFRSAIQVQTDHAPKDAPECWSEGWDPNDAGCRYNCRFYHSCKLNFSKKYDVESVEGGSSSVVRHGTVAIRRKGGSVLSTDHPIFDDDIQKATPLVRKMVHNAMIGGFRAAVNEVFDLMDRAFADIPKF